MTDERIMTCEEALRFLAVYLDGELEAAAERDIENHLARCRSCFSRADFEQRMKTQVAALGRSEVSPEFAERMRRLVGRFAASPETPES